MRRRGRFGISKDESFHGSDRPWVYFMIDCFFLVTQFFVLTFHVHSDEVLLPQKTMGARPGTPPYFPAPHNLGVHVSNTAGKATYEFMQQKVDLDGLTRMLVSVGGPETTVKVSYNSEVPFGDVIAVFNACQKVGIERCGIIPIHE